MRPGCCLHKSSQTAPAHSVPVFLLSMHCLTLFLFLFLFQIQGPSCKASVHVSVAAALMPSKNAMLFLSPMPSPRLIFAS
jgi:hypothetical protein